MSDGVNELIATLSGTGEYEWSTPDPSEWDIHSATWNIDDRGRRFAESLEPAPDPGCRFAEVDGLDTDVVCDADRAPVDLDVRIVFGDPVTCRSERNVGLTVSGVLVEGELTGGVTGLDASAPTVHRPAARSHELQRLRTRGFRGLQRRRRQRLRLHARRRMSDGHRLVRRR